MFLYPIHQCRNFKHHLFNFQKMPANLDQRLKSFQHEINLYVEHGIAPIHSKFLDMKQLYHELGGRPLGNCGGCLVDVINFLQDVSKDRKI